MGHPDSVFSVEKKRFHKIVAQRGGFVGFVEIVFNGIAVVAGKSVARSQPYIALVVLYHCLYLLMWQSLLTGNVEKLEIVRHPGT